VFGTSQCKYCTNDTLYIVIPILISGALLVVVMFLLNLTVTDGAINGFILYVNILSINSPVLLKHHTITYVLVSLANLDLGIETCFYNGMDDYAKMWLQLSFPFYLIFIATVLIITSRYSTRIQRLTARRALPVLATLFLLSYTKILRTVSSVLFSYSTITRIPNKTTKLVWSVDANISLFNIKFITIFIGFSLLFFIIIPFNIVLIFTRALSRFRFINHFKPLLDAYQGPYKNQYYWTGLQLVMRSLFFGLSALNKDTNFSIAIILLAAMEGFQGQTQPFVSNFKNVQELIIMLNLIGLLVFSLYTKSITAIANVSVSIAFIHFTFILLNNLRLFQYKPVIHSKHKSTVAKLLVSINHYIAKKWKLLGIQQTSNNNVQNIPMQNIPEVAYNYREYREPLIGEYK